MARKTVISKVLDVEAQDGIIEFPQNRALYADQFTDEAPQSDDEREGFKAKSMKDVFEHYQPSKKGIALENEEGGAVYEDFDFKSVKDFEDEQLIEHSAAYFGDEIIREIRYIAVETVFGKPRVQIIENLLERIVPDKARDPVNQCFNIDLEFSSEKLADYRTAFKSRGAEFNRVDFSAAVFMKIGADYRSAHTEAEK